MKSLAKALSVMDLLVSKNEEMRHHRNIQGPWECLRERCIASWLLW